MPVDPLRVALVLAIEDEEAIWNITSSEYFRTDLKDAAWTRIRTNLSARGFNYTVDHLKKTWKNIKDQQRKAKSDGDKNWPYKDFMRFMETADIRGTRYSSVDDITPFDDNDAFASQRSGTGSETANEGVGSEQPRKKGKKRTR